MKQRQQTNQRDRKITNWCRYNNDWVNRKSLTIWLEEKVVDNWLCCSQHGDHGFKFSDLAIETALRLKAMFQRSLRARERLIHWLFQRIGLPLRAPDYSGVRKVMDGRDAAPGASCIAR